MYWKHCQDLIASDELSCGSFSGGCIERLVVIVIFEKKSVRQLYQYCAHALPGIWKLLQ